MPWALRGLSNGVITTRWPRHPDEYADSFASSIETVDEAAPDRAAQEDAIAHCPTGALSRDESGRVRCDRGRCVLCGLCVTTAPQSFQWYRGSEVAALTRGELVTDLSDDSPERVAEIRRELASRVRQLRQSVHIRHVDSGSDGCDEWEVQALTNPVYDIHRLGIYFTASPRHADILLVTGIGAAGMSESVRHTLEAMPQPTVVIAAGVDAVSGGVFAGGYMTNGGVSAEVPIDVWIPGSPATPFALLNGILLALDRLPRGRRSS